MTNSPISLRSTIQAVIAELRKDPTVGGGFAQWGEVSGVGAKVRRGPIGVMLGLAPFNCAPPRGSNTSDHRRVCRRRRACDSRVLRHRPHRPHRPSP